MTIVPMFVTIVAVAVLFAGIVVFDTDRWVELATPGAVVVVVSPFETEIFELLLHAAAANAITATNTPNERRTPNLSRR
jgi:hypothetical protein